MPTGGAGCGWMSDLQVSRGRGGGDDRAEALFSREEVLGGLPARRAQALLFLIESQAAQLATQSRLAAEPETTDAELRKQELAFLEAFALGRQPPRRATIQDLERYAPEWDDLVPDNPRLRAVLAHLIAQKYRFSAGDVPRLRVALGLDDAAVQRAYQQQYGTPLAEVYQPRVGLLERCRWALSAFGVWVDGLPPFWYAAVTIAARGLPSGMLALPIAVVGVGPLAALVILLVILGLNAVTMLWLAEALARSGSIRYGRAFLGRVVSDFLGGGASALLSGQISLSSFLLLLSSPIGLAVALAALTGLPHVIWLGLLLVVVLIHLWQQGQGQGVATTVLLGAVSVSLVLALTVLAVPYYQPAYVLESNEGQGFQFSSLKALVGILLVICGQQSYMAQSAKKTLERDPDGRGLIWGSLAGLMAAPIVAIVFVLAVLGVVPAAELAGRAGTALDPLAERLGPLAQGITTVIVLLVLGMNALRHAERIFSLVDERLPSRRRPVLMLPRGSGRVLVGPRAGRSGPTVAVSYLGPEGNAARLRLDLAGGAYGRFDITVDGEWDADSVPELDRAGVRLELAVLEVQPDTVRLRVDTSLPVSFEGDWHPPQSVSALIDQPPEERRLLAGLLRRGGATLTELAQETGMEPARAQRIADDLVRRGLVERAGSGPDQLRYAARSPRRRSRALPAAVWEALADEEDTASRVGAGWRARLDDWLDTIREGALGERGRFAVSVLPVVGAFILADILLRTGAGTFSSIVGIGGVLMGALISGAFPALLLVAGRRKGEIPARPVAWWLTLPVLLVAMYAIFMANLFFHGLVVWQDPVQRGGALLMGVLILIMTARVIRQGELEPRAVVELRRELQSGKLFYSVVALGVPVPAEVELSYPEAISTLKQGAGEIEDPARLSSLTFRLPAGLAPNLKVWAHQVVKGRSEALAGELTIRQDGRAQELDLEACRGQVIAPLEVGAIEVTVKLRPV